LDIMCIGLYENSVKHMPSYLSITGIFFIFSFQNTNREHKASVDFACLVFCVGNICFSL